MQEAKKERIFCSIDNRALDKRKLLFNDELAANFTRFNVKLLTKNPLDIVDSIRGTPNLATDPFITHLSRPDDPRIIIEHGASHCSILVAVDRLGNVVTVHKPLVNSTTEEVVEILSKCSFIQNVASQLHGEKMIFMTATGASATQSARETLLSQLKEIFDQPIDYLFLSEPKSEESSKKGFFSELKKLVKNLYLGLTNANDRLRLVSEIFVIPASNSASGSLELAIPHDLHAQRKRKLQHQVFIEAVDVLKRKMHTSALNEAA